MIAAVAKNQEPRCTWCGKRMPLLGECDMRKHPADELPTVDGYYVLWFDLTPLRQVVQWRSAEPGWRLGAQRIFPAFYLGPLPQ